MDGLPEIIGWNVTGYTETLRVSVWPEGSSGEVRLSFGTGGVSVLLPARVAWDLEVALGKVLGSMQKAGHPALGEPEEFEPLGDPNPSAVIAERGE